MSEENTSADLLDSGEPAGDQPVDNSVDNPAEASNDGDRSPMDHGGQLADWIPSELHDPGKRSELFKAVGLDPDKLQEIPSERPEFLPEKFWEEGKGPRLEALSKSYSELEKKLHDKGAIKPEPPEKYEVTLPEGVEAPEDSEVLSEADTELFKELGLDNDSAQKVVNHFWEQVIPLVTEQQGKVEMEKLAGGWNMASDANEFKQRLGAVKQWAEQNLPKEVQEHLRGSASGVQAMWGMMNARRPAGDGSPPAQVSSEKIQEMINSDEYWDENNPNFRKQVGDMVRKQAGG